jgi:hypothetical protein
MSAGIRGVGERVQAVGDWDPAVIALGKVILGLGLVGVALWLSPYTLTDLLLTFGIPLLIIAMLLAGTGIVGSGFLEMVNSRQLGQKVQDYVREARDNLTESQ